MSIDLEVLIFLSLEVRVLLHAVTPYTANDNAEHMVFGSCNTQSHT